MAEGWGVEGSIPPGQKSPETIPVLFCLPSTSIKAKHGAIYLPSQFQRVRGRQMVGSRASELLGRDPVPRSKLEDLGRQLTS